MSVGDLIQNASASTDEEPEMGMASSVLKWSSLLGGIGFAAGFFGPMIFAPQANQGPMLGIFITGPAGFVGGAIVGFIKSLLGR